MGEGKNNSGMQDVPSVGPLPVGFYSINPPVDSETHGPYALPLTPDPGNQMYGRSAFMIHGDSLEHPGFASQGCIIMARPIRMEIWESADRQLQVISGE